MQLRSILEYNLNYSGYQSGIATSDSANHFAVGLVDGETLEYSLAYVDSNVELELFKIKLVNNIFLQIHSHQGAFWKKGQKLIGSLRPKMVV